MHTYNWERRDSYWALCFSLLQTVPSDVLSKGEVIADSYREPEDEETGSLDPDLKQLESILWIPNILAVSE